MNWWEQQGNPWGNPQQEQAQEKQTKVIPLESLARQNNCFCTIQNVHDGWMIRWGTPEQYLAVSNRAKLHEAVDLFAGTPPEKRNVVASLEPNPVQEYRRQENAEQEWVEFAGELAACVQGCQHGMSAGHPILPMVNALLEKARRKGVL